MDFKLSDEQQMLQDTAARLVRDNYAFEAREKFAESELGYSVAFWQQLSELGLTAVPFAEAFGGFGVDGGDAWRPDRHTAGNSPVVVREVD